MTGPTIPVGYPESSSYSDAWAGASSLASYRGRVHVVCQPPDSTIEISKAGKELETYVRRRTEDPRFGLSESTVLTLNSLYCGGNFTFDLSIMSCGSFSHALWCLIELYLYHLCMPLDTDELSIWIVLLSSLGQVCRLDLFGSLVRCCTCTCKLHVNRDYVYVYVLAKITIHMHVHNCFVSIFFMK